MDDVLLINSIFKIVQDIGKAFPFSIFLSIDAAVAAALKVRHNLLSKGSLF